jgi:hypothetical protein
MFGISRSRVYVGLGNQTSPVILQGFAWVELFDARNSIFDVPATEQRKSASRGRDWIDDCPGFSIYGWLKKGAFDQEGLKPGHYFVHANGIDATG